MSFVTFELERWQSTWENRVRFNLSESGVHPLSVKELLELAGAPLDPLLDVRLGYSQSNGTDRLRERIAALYPGASADQVLVTTGSAEANYVACWRVLEPGDTVAMMLPNYMQIWGQTQNRGAKIRGLTLDESESPELKALRPSMPVLILSMHSEEQYARRAFRAGASGYVTKDCSREELVAAVQKVSTGSKYITAALAEKLVLDLERGSDAPPHETLSDREYEVLRWIASGKTVSEIAGILSLSDKTISTYRACILEKLNLRSTADIIRYAIQHHLDE